MEMSNTKTFSFGEIDDHQEVVAKHHRFASRVVDGMGSERGSKSGRD